MKRIRKTAIALGVAMMMLLATSLTRAQVMQQVPAEALLVLKVNNLTATNEKVMKLANEMSVKLDVFAVAGGASRAK